MHAPEAGSLFRGGTSRNFGILAEIPRIFPAFLSHPDYTVGAGIDFRLTGSGFLPIAVRKGRGLYRQ